MSAGLVGAAYVAAAILFILSLGGLSGQESAKRAVWYGIAGMALAVLATVLGPGVGNHALLAVLVLAGAAAGVVVAQRVQMTEMPQLVAALHSFVGLAAVLIGFNAHLEWRRVCWPVEEARVGLAGFAGILAHKTTAEINVFLVEVALGVFIGAVTLTGSVVALRQARGPAQHGGGPTPGRHLLNAGAAAASLVLLVLYVATGWFVWLALLTLAALFIGYHLIMGIGGATCRSSCPCSTATRAGPRRRSGSRCRTTS
jgi:NAD(P) transhydrogenase subunit beta